MKVSFRKIVTGSLVVVLSSSLVASAASGGIGGRPANPDPDNPRTQSIFLYTLKPGDTKNDQIYLSNGGDTDEIVQLYAVDGTVSNTGAFTCKQEVEDRNGIGKAIQLAKNEVEVPAHSSLTVDFKLTVPKVIDVGEHDGCIAIQKKYKEDGKKTEGAIQVRTRMAVRVAVLIPGEIHREVSLVNFKASPFFMKGNDKVAGPDVSFGLKNVGNVSADVLARVHVRDLFGRALRIEGASREKYFFGGQYPVIAGTTFDLNYNIEHQPFFGGWYKVKVDIEYNKKAGTFGVNEAGDTVKAETDEVTIFFWPSTTFFIMLALLLFAAASFIAWHFMQKREIIKRTNRFLKRSSDKLTWVAYTVQDGDTLSSLAKNSGTPVNKIVIMNKLREPYKLSPGQKIYLPRARD